MSWWDRSLCIARIIVFLVICGIVGYESFAPCGLRSMKADTMLWIHRCGHTAATEVPK